MPPQFRRAMSGYDALEALQHPNFPPPSSLTKLYTDTKQSSLTASPPVSTDVDPEVQSLNRKLRIQKDRLIAWGLEWTDEVGNAQGDIDKSVERAGLTEVVSSVMENIKGILEEVDRLKKPQQAINPEVSKRAMPSPVSRKQWSTTEKEQYGDFLRDFTAANDLLCELSRSRRAAEPEPEPSKKRAAESSGKEKWGSKMGLAEAAQQLEFELQGSVASPTETQPSSVLKVHHSMLLLPEEGPPPYHASGALPWGPTGPGYAPRTFGHLRRTESSTNPQAESRLDPVLIEYVSYDRIYKTSDIPLPLNRLDDLFALLARLPKNSTNALSKLIAYFEDPEQARFGLVFEMPTSWSRESLGSPQHIFTAEPISLFALLQNASKLQSTSSTNSSAYVPPLEDRFRLAYEAVSGFSYLQNGSFTHRNVSSSSIALPPLVGNFSQANGDCQYNVRKPVICSFDLFSEYDVDSSPEFLHQNIYRHPDDPRVMGPTASSNYDLRFDLYSLGLVLLEIGMWHPLADLFKEKYSLKDFRMRVERIWIKRLSSRCGTAYMRCVQDCFNAGSQSASTNTGPSLAQVYATVRGRLERCCSIDSDEEPEIEDVRGQGNAETASNYSQALEKPAPLSKEPSFVQEPEALTPLDSFDQTGKNEKRAPRFQFPSLELPTEVLWEWNNAIEGKLARIVQRALGSSKESCCIYLCYTGENEQLAKPTICVGCTSVKKVRAAIRRHLKYNNEVFELAVLKGSISRSKSAHPRRSQGNSTSVAVRNPYHHERPLCGASIGAWRDSEHSPAVSFGGIVMVDDTPYGMSVHHLLEEPDEEGDSNDTAQDSKAPMRSMERANPPVPSLGSGPSNTMMQLIEYDSDDDELDDDDDMDEDDDLDFDIDDDDTLELDPSTQNAGDTDGISGSRGEEIIITQPALYDVAEDFFPCDEDRDEDHIDSHSFGHVHASSGLRRCTRDGVEHEIDWLLMKLDKNRLQPYNLIAGGKRYCQQDGLFDFRPALVDPVCRQHYPVAEDLYPRRIARSDQLSGLQVHCVGRTSGLGHGRISQTMHLVRFQGRRTFSRTWSVTGTFGRGGDSGAWVVDNEQGRICGHVLAWSNHLGMAYVSPMDVMFDDIRDTLSAKKVSLPGAEDEIKPVTFPVTEIKGLTLEDIRHHKHLLAKHMLSSGNPAHVEREWSARRAALGQLASG